MEPTKKNPAIDDLLTALSGDSRHEAVRSERCMNPPIGCGRKIDTFEDFKVIEVREYTISGLCNVCQRSIFSSEED